MSQANICKPLSILLCCSMLGAPALAGTSSSQVHSANDAVTVSFGDLDLTRASGVETLYQRLRAGARQVCGSPDGREMMERSRLRRECIGIAMSEVVDRIDNDKLRELYAQDKAG